MLWWIERFGRRLLSFLLVACVVGAFAYLVFCKQIGRIAQVNDGTTVTVVGRASDCISKESNGTGPGVYRLEDPTGAMFVVTRVGAPREEALVVVRGAKRTKNGHAVVVESYRVGTF